MSEAADRTIPATPRRRELARQRGLMPMASLPAWVATVGTAILLLPAWARATVPAATVMMERSLVAAVEHVRSPHRHDPLLPAAVVLPTLAVVAASGVVGLAVRVLLDGSRWRLSRAVPALERISLSAGLARIFSAATLAAIAGHAAGLAMLVTVAAVSAGSLVAIIGSRDAADDPAGLAISAQRAVVPVVAAAAVVAACTWGASRLRFERRIRMTPQEYADEARSMQADPKIRLMHARRRASGASGERASHGS